LIDMRSENEIKADLLAALEIEVDAPLHEKGFKRWKGSTHYTRKKASASHVIAFHADFFPRYRPSAEAHLLPKMRLLIPAVSERALALVGGNDSLLAGAPEVIVNQPIEFTAPKNHRVRWFAAGLAEFQDRAREIVDFARTWTIPLLDELTGPGSLIHMYRQEDARLLKQPHWYLYVVAAFDLLGRRDEARSVLEAKLGKPGSRRRFAVAFENLGLGTTSAE
jgi:hypothetical protein